MKLFRKKKFKLIVLLFMLLGCDNSNEFLEFKTATLQPQEYPITITSWNYNDEIPKEIRELTSPIYFLEEGLYSSAEKEIKSRIIESYRSEDTIISRTIFDRFGNVIYWKEEIWDRDLHQRYRLNNTGQLQQKEINENGSEDVTKFIFKYTSEGLFQKVLKITKDTTVTFDIEYDSLFQITKAGPYTYRYDSKGNCVEGWIKYDEPHCGNIVTHWERNYDDSNILISESTNVDYLYPFSQDLLDSIPKIQDYKHDSVYNSKMQLIEITSRLNDSIKSRIMIDYYD